MEIKHVKYGVIFTRGKRYAIFHIKKSVFRSEKSIFFTS